VRVADRSIPLRLAVIDAVAELAPFTVLIMNTADIAPARTVTAAGVVADELLQDIGIVRPPSGAAELSFTIPSVDLPPITVAGLKVSEVNVGGLIVNVALLEVGPADAVILAVVGVETARVMTLNVVSTLPAGIKTAGGTTADPESLFSFTRNPPGGAGVFRFRIAVAYELPPTALSSRVTAVNVGASNQRIDVTVCLPYTALICTCVRLATGFVLTMNDVPAPPPLMVTEAGRVTTRLLLLILTVAVVPLPFIDTVAADGSPPTTSLELKISVDSTSGLTVN
jgi:hypothetical protein